MKLAEDKVILTEDELSLVKRANMMASPTTAGLMLKNLVSNNTLTEDADQKDLNYYVQVILNYRRKNFEVK